MKKLINHILLGLNLLVAIAIGICYLAAYINPEKIWIPALFSLVYPIILIINIGFIVYWTLSRKVYLFISIVFILLGLGLLSNLFSYKSVDDSLLKDEKSFKILSYNTRLFDIYKWSGKDDTSAKIIDLIQKIDADVICLQEFVTESQGELSGSNLKNKFVQGKYDHVVYTFKSRNKGQRHGIATYSRFPILSKGEIRFKNSPNITIYSDLLINHDTIRIYNSHLESIRFQRNDFDIINNDIEKGSSVVDNIVNIVRKLRNAFRIRASQADILNKHIANSPYSVIVCGDFNDTPYSNTYHKIKSKMNDAFNISGRGFGTTYKKKILSFRIDFILHDKIFESSGFKTTRQELSDHYPVSCYIRKKAS